MGRVLKEYGLEVSEWGHVMNMKTGNVLKHQKCRNGYHRISVNINGKRKTLSVHRLVAIAFIPNPDNKPDINHKDGDKSNNRLSNLEWVTKSENQRHAIDTGLKTRSGHPEKPERNAEAIAMRKSGKSYREIGDHFGISWIRVRQICLNE